ncbi:hypothetical protein NA57DRAFT_75969 [Rhizodiscina lignyota]|uniref:Heterokaryon incompatibility domain-containing protein n=1 Tax=Rhizodiscina lignyota TaxID=1504668 RepID=A0A9P4IG88_9PEZI|nr:hypothetical protein NA57DRAFT_75969 [Rhizodiscina lignyota]
MDPSTYHPLASTPSDTPNQFSDAKGDIRLLEVHPGEAASLLSGNIIHCSFTDHPKFEALSYTWGDLEKSHAVICDGAEIRITACLQRALRAFRLKDRTRRLWIDQICLYQIASRTIVFLDIEDAEPLGTPLNYVRLLIDIGNFRKDKNTDVPTLSAFQELFAHPWFSRTWILQEFAMAKSITYFYRGQTLSWELLHMSRATALVVVPLQEDNKSAQWLAQENLFSIYIAYGGRSNFNTLTRYWMSCTSTRLTRLWNPPVRLHSTFVDLLQDGRHNDSTDPRDHVAELSQLLTVDYNLDVSSVFTRAAVQCILATNTLDVLTCVESDTVIKDLPSWVPDWTSQHLFPLNRLTTQRDLKAIFSPILRSRRYHIPAEKLPAIQVSFSADHKVLNCKGRILTSIKHVSSAWTKPAAEPDGKTVREWANLFSHGRSDDLKLRRRFNGPTLWTGKLWTGRTPAHSAYHFWEGVLSTLAVRCPNYSGGSDTSSVLDDETLNRQWQRGSYYPHSYPTLHIVGGSNVTSAIYISSWLQQTLGLASVGRRIARTEESLLVLAPPNA